MHPRSLLLRANALFLVVAGLGGLRADLTGAFLHQGVVATVLGQAPHAAIGFVEAHGLALILGVLLALASPSRRWHATGAAIHLLLGASNLTFWAVFTSTDSLLLGYVTTGLHIAFFVLQTLAAVTFRSTPSRAVAGPASAHG